MSSDCRRGEKPGERNNVRCACEFAGTGRGNERGVRNFYQISSVLLSLERDRQEEPGELSSRPPNTDRDQPRPYLTANEMQSNSPMTADSHSRPPSVNDKRKQEGCAVAFARHLIVLGCCGG